MAHETCGSPVAQACKVEALAEANYAGKQPVQSSPEQRGSSALPGDHKAAAIQLLSAPQIVAQTA